VQIHASCSHDPLRILWLILEYLITCHTKTGNGIRGALAVRLCQLGLGNVGINSLAGGWHSMLIMKNVSNLCSCYPAVSAVEALGHVVLTSLSEALDATFTQLPDPLEWIQQAATFRRYPNSRRYPTAQALLRVRTQ